MELLQPTSFASAVASSKEQLINISKIVSKHCRQAKADSFLKACDTLDFTTANTILDDTVRELTGHDSVSIALSAFADKFPQLLPEFKNSISSALLEIDKAKAINNYYAQIVQIIRTSNHDFKHHKSVSILQIVLNALKRFFSRLISEKKSSSEKIVYTQRDLDMILLIHELAEIYRKTDEYFYK